MLGTSWFAAVAAEAGPGKTVAVVGDGAVGLMAILAAKQLGAERIIAMSRNADRTGVAATAGVRWPVELWLGVTVLSTLTAACLALLAAPPAPTLVESQQPAGLRNGPS